MVVGTSEQGRSIPAQLNRAAGPIFTRSRIVEVAIKIGQLGHAYVINA
jgi:hypothetical protein